MRTAATIEQAGIQLLPDAQSHGTGTHAIAELVDEAVATGRALVLTVEVDTPRAQDLYRRTGFVETGRTDDGFAGL